LNMTVTAKDLVIGPFWNIEIEVYQDSQEFRASRRQPRDCTCD
jgi:hypothetical protein